VVKLPSIGDDGCCRANHTLQLVIHKFRHASQQAVTCDSCQMHGLASSQTHHRVIVRLIGVADTAQHGRNTWHWRQWHSR